MIKTWRDAPDCPPEWDDEAEWTKKHTCGDCFHYHPCPCMLCRHGWCTENEEYVQRGFRACEAGEPR